MYFTETVYGPAVHSSARTVLARPGVDYSRAEVDAIRAAAGGTIPDPVESPAEPASTPAVGHLIPPAATPLVTDPAVNPTPAPGPLTEPVDELPHLGGGWYGLPNGERVHGREAAEEALATLSDGGDGDGDGDGSDAAVQALLTEGTAEEVLARVGDDKDKAQATLAAERAGKNRKGVVEPLEKLLAG